MVVRTRTLLLGAILVSASGLSACSDDSNENTAVGGGDAGGATNTGGKSNMGGKASGGTSAGVGGKTAGLGGNTAASGGAMGVGGTTAAAGGSAAQGGTTAAAGGSAAQGGTTAAAGGSAAQGGTTAAAGGSAAQGGTTAAAGGSAAQGGTTAAAGGSAAQGGTTAAAGGSAAQGGTTAAAGGSAAQGGTAGTSSTSAVTLDLSTWSAYPASTGITYDGATQTLTAVNVESFGLPLGRTLSAGQSVAVRVTGTNNGTVGLRSWLVNDTQSTNSDMATYVGTSLASGAFTLSYTLTVKTGVTAGILFIKGPTYGVNIDNVTFSSITVTF